MERDTTTNEILLTRNEFSMCLNGLDEAAKGGRISDRERYVNIVGFMGEAGLDFEEGDRLPGRDGKIALNLYMANLLLFEMSGNVQYYSDFLEDIKKENGPAIVAQIRHELTNQRALLDELESFCKPESGDMQDISINTRLSSAS